MVHSLSLPQAERGARQRGRGEDAPNYVNRSFRDTSVQPMRGSLPDCLNVGVGSGGEEEA
jgi:hypothetical protein